LSSTVLGCLNLLERDELTGAGRVAVVADDLAPWRTEKLKALLLAADLHRSSLQAALAAGHRYDAVVLDVGDPCLRGQKIVDLLYHLKVGGRLLVPGALKGFQPFAGESDESFAPAREFLEALLGHRAAPSLRSLSSLGMRREDWHCLKRAVVSADMVGDTAVLINRRRVQAKLDELAVNEFVRATGRGRVIDSIAGKAWTPRASLRESESARGRFWANEWNAPDVFLREYRDVVCRPGQIAQVGRSLLPDSYRHIGRPRLGNHFMNDVAPLFATPKRKRPPDAELPGPHFYWDSEYRGHFGHALTEQLSRMWAFQRAKDEYPDLKVFMATNRHRRQAVPFEVEILARLGARLDDLVFVQGPVRIERLIAATPMFSQPLYVHPDIAQVWDRLGDSLDADASDRVYPERFFVGRRHAKRACVNAEEVEAIFVERGFEVVYPEDYSLPDQVRLFRSAKVIAGYGGSGLFNAMFAEEPKHLILVSSETYTAQNEWMIAGVRGHRVDVAWCRAERGVGAKPARVLQTPFTFDRDREGRFLSDVLAEL